MIFQIYFTKQETKSYHILRKYYLIHFKIIEYFDTLKTKENK